MAETFFGPWGVQLARFEQFPQHGFTIKGSNNADGRYEADPGEPVDLQVDGSEWTITLEEYRAFPPNAGWRPTPMTRHDRFGLQEGLTVTVDSFVPSRPHFLGIELICTSLDPDIAVEPKQNPYDFTIPENG